MFNTLNHGQQLSQHQLALKKSQSHTKSPFQAGTHQSMPMSPHWPLIQLQSVKLLNGPQSQSQQPPPSGQPHSIHMKENQLKLEPSFQSGYQLNGNTPPSTTPLKFTHQLLMPQLASSTHMLLQLPLFHQLITQLFTPPQ